MKAEGKEQLGDSGKYDRIILICISKRIGGGCELDSCGSAEGDICKLL
jgi:hypothetical protein